MMVLVKLKLVWPSQVVTPSADLPGTSEGGRMGEPGSMIWLKPCTLRA